MQERQRWVFLFREMLPVVLLAAGMGIQPMEGRGEAKPTPSAAGGHGQPLENSPEPTPPGTLTVFPRLGLLVPGPELYSLYKNFAGDGPVEWTSGSLGRALMVGLGLEVQFPGPGMALRGEVARTFQGWLHATHGVLIPRILWDPPRIENTFFDIPAHLTLAGIQAILPLRLAGKGLQPFVLLGFSGKWYGFGSPSPENTVGAILPSSGFVPSADLGGGVAVAFRGLSLEFQVRDNVNRYWGRTQNDLFLSVAWSQRMTGLRRRKQALPWRARRRDRKFLRPGVST